MKSILFASALFVAGVGSAVAADVEPAFEWTGIYAGANAGSGWGNADYGFPYRFGQGPFWNYFNRNADDAFSHRMDGGLIGGHAGYNHQINNLVLGVETSLSLTDVGATVESPYYPSSDRVSTRVNWLGTLTPRLGFASGKWLVSAKGGLAYGQIRSRVEDMSGNGINVTETLNRAGWTAGAGADYALTKNVIVGFDYNYVDLGSGTISRFGADSVTGALESVGSTHSVHPKFSAVMARVSWKFN